MIEASGAANETNDAHTYYNIMQGYDIPYFFHENNNIALVSPNF